MHESTVPTLLISGEMTHHLVEQKHRKTLVEIYIPQFRPYLFWLMLDLIAFDLNAMVENLFFCACGEISSKGHRNPTCQHFTKNHQDQVSGCQSTHYHDEH